MKDALPTTPPSDALEYAVALLTQIRHEWYTFTGYSQLKQDIDKFLDTPRAGGRVVPLHPAKSCSEGVEAGSVTQSETASNFDPGIWPRSAGGECKEVEVIDPYVMDLVRQHGSTMTNAEIVQRFLPKERLSIQSAIGSIDYKALYHDLLFAVESKWPGETRHQTAMRYIQQSERGDGIAKEAK